MTWGSTPTALPWDQGITWRTEIVSAVSGFLSLDVDFVTNKVLRARSNDTEEDLITSYIQAAEELYEHETGYSLAPKRLAMHLSGAPSGGWIELQSPPVRGVVSISYYDGDGVSQEYDGSPHEWSLVTGGRYSVPMVQLGVSQQWPTLQDRRDALTVTYDVGYLTPAEVPAMVKTGLALVVGELYKNPDLSNADGQVANLLKLERFWKKRY